MEIVITGILISVACALLGTFLILRKMAMMSDAISHAILPGLVAGYFFAKGPDLFAGFLGALVAALVTVTLVEALKNTQRVGGESAIGIVFPAMFALGTFLVARFFENVHLDTDAVLFGNIEFVAFDRLFIGDVDFGPQSYYVAGALCLINLLFITVFYKELKLATFDAGLAATLGFSPFFIHYALMALVSVTSVGAFTSVGAVLVVALMIVPAAAAYLLTDKLPMMIGLAAGIGALSAVLGYGLALTIDSSVAGAIVSVAGAFFFAAMLFSPSHGLIAKARRIERQRVQIGLEALLVHLLNHEGEEGEAHESEMLHLSSELRWLPQFAQQIVGVAANRGLVMQLHGHLILTDNGRRQGQQLMVH